MSFLPYPPTTTTEAIQVFKQDVQIAHDVVHGGDTTDVATENGNVPSFSKLVKTLTDEVEAATGVDVSLRSELAAANSTVPIGGVEAGKIATSVQYLTPEQFYQAGDIDDTASIMRMGAAITNGSRCEFQKREYVISLAGTGLSAYATSPNGVAIIDLYDKKNVTIKGNGATIKLVNHNITTGGGLMFFRGVFVPRLHASGFNFDYTCTGVNTSGSFYPWVGGFVVFDPDTNANDVTKISNDLLFENMTFKMFHPYGQWATSPNAYLGDPNNGYKLFTVFVSGDYLANTWARQNRNVTLRDMTLKDGHNGYGLWVWACNNVKFINPTAENFTSKYSNHLGAYVGTGVPLVRYHQFLCTDVLVENINFNGMKSGDKTAGFEGASLAVRFSTNNTAANLTNGTMEVRGGVIRGGNGDLSKASQDILIFCSAYGILKISDIHFDAHPIDANSKEGGAIVYSSESTGGTGYGEIHLSGITFSKNCDKYNSIQIANGVSSAATDRRCKLLKIDNVHSMCQFQFGLDLSGGSSATFQGVERVEVDGLTIDGRACQTFTSASTNSRAMFLAAASGDIVRFNRLTIESKYYAMNVANMNAGSSLIIDDYEERTVTTRYLGAGKIAVITTRGNGSPESVQVAAVGSEYKRLDGGALTTLYVKESGTGNTGWVAK
jgi:hypothetical protein